MIEQFPMARLHLHAEACSPIELPAFSGSTLRGAFGRALKRAACTTGLDDCTACPRYRSCKYPAIFEPPPPPDAPRKYSRIPNPYVIEPPSLGARSLQPGESLDFALVLVGDALGALPLVLAAWRAALEQGIGKGRGRARLVRVSDEGGATLQDGADGPLAQPADMVQVPPCPDAGGIVLNFSTPFNLRRRGRDVGATELTASDLLMALVRRADDMARLQLRQPLALDRAALARQARRVRGVFELERQGWRRHSSRQQRYMRIGGLTGTCRLQGPWHDFWPFLWLGQWLHVGKKSSFGLGRYTLEVPGT